MLVAIEAETTVANKTSVTFMPPPRRVSLDDSSVAQSAFVNKRRCGKKVLEVGSRYSVNHRRRSQPARVVVDAPNDVGEPQKVAHFMKGQTSNRVRIAQNV